MKSAHEIYSTASGRFSLLSAEAWHILWGLKLQASIFFRKLLGVFFLLQLIFAGLLPLWR
jgi:hypothetical protein